MAKENLKQVAVRMSPRLHSSAMKMAKREKVSFGEFVRQAVDLRIDHLKECAMEPGGEPSPDSLRQMLYRRIPGPEAKILRVIVESWPNQISNQECAEMAGYSGVCGAFNNPRSRLRSLGLIDYPSPGMLRARDVLFPDGNPA